MSSSGSRRVVRGQERTRSAAPSRDRILDIPRSTWSGQDVVHLQNAAGNSAVAQLLGAQPVTVQRDKKSAEFLKELAVPRVAEGPAIKVQESLAEAIEKLVLEEYGTTETEGRRFSPSELNLGGILVLDLPRPDHKYTATAEDGSQERVKETSRIFKRLTSGSAPAATFVPLAGPANPNRSTGAEFGHQMAKAGLGPLVVENALKTMIDAGQFEYLRLAGLPNDEWKILVELHYIRSRPKDMAGFHKDTRGQSLFVNLNYHVPGHRVRGPEYVLNPPRAKAHDNEIFGTGSRARTLPKVFGDDLKKTRKALDPPTRIESAGVVPDGGYVAFVDEAIHHATPWYGHRYVTSGELKDYLERNHIAEFIEIARAKREYGLSRKPSLFKSLKDYVAIEVIEPDTIQKWRRLHEMAETDQPSQYTRADFKGVLGKAEFYDMLRDVGGQPDAKRDKAGSGGWHSARIPGTKRSPKSVLSPVGPKDEAPLERVASRKDLTKGWPKQLPDDVPRRFFRSWVRAVPADQAPDLAT